MLNLHRGQAGRIFSPTRQCCIIVCTVCCIFYWLSILGRWPRLFPPYGETGDGFDALPAPWSSLYPHSIKDTNARKRFSNKLIGYVRHEAGTCQGQSSREAVRRRNSSVRNTWRNAWWSFERSTHADSGRPQPPASVPDVTEKPTKQRPPNRPRHSYTTCMGTYRLRNVPGFTVYFPSEQGKVAQSTVPCCAVPHAVCSG